MCEKDFETYTGLKKHLASKQHKKKVQSSKEGVGLRYDKYSESSSEDGLDTEPTVKEKFLEYVKENFCPKQGYGFDCNKCCKKKRTADKPCPVDSYEAVRRLAQEANRVFEAEVRAEQEYRLSQLEGETERRGSSRVRREHWTRMVEMIAGNADGEYRHDFGSRWGVEDADSDEEEEEGLWDRMQEKPDRKEYSFKGKSKYCKVLFLDPVEKLSMVPIEEGEIVKRKKGGLCIIEKARGSQITFRIVVVESLKNTPLPPCC